MMNRLFPIRSKKKSRPSDEPLEYKRAVYTFQPRPAPSTGNSKPSIRPGKTSKKVSIKEHTPIPSQSKKSDSTKKSTVVSGRFNDNATKPTSIDSSQHLDVATHKSIHVEDQNTSETSSTKFTEITPSRPLNDVAESSVSQIPNVNVSDIEKLGHSAPVNGNKNETIMLESNVELTMADTIDVQNIADSIVSDSVTRESERVPSKTPKTEEQQKLRTSLILEDISNDIPDDHFYSSMHSIGNDRQGDQRELKDTNGGKPTLTYDEVVGEHSINEIAFKNLSDNGDALSDDDITLNSLDVGNVINETLPPPVENPMVDMKYENTNDDQSIEEDARDNKNKFQDALLGEHAQVLNESARDHDTLSKTESPSQTESTLQDNNDGERIDDVITVSESSESDTDWDSVESSSGSEGDGLQRGINRKKTNQSRPRREYLTQSTGDSSDEDDQDPDFFKDHKKDDLDESERSFNVKDLVLAPKTPEKAKKKKTPVIEEVVPLPMMLSPKKQQRNQDSIPDQDVFAALVEQLDASMSEMMSEGDKQLGKPGPPKSPGNTSHERLFRQNFTGATLNKNSGGEQNGNANASDESDNDSGPDFFDDDDDSLFNSSVVKKQASTSSEEIMAMLNAEPTPNGAASSVNGKDGTTKLHDIRGPSTNETLDDDDDDDDSLFNSTAVKKRTSASSEEIMAMLNAGSTPNDVTTGSTVNDKGGRTKQDDIKGPSSNETLQPLNGKISFINAEPNLAKNLDDDEGHGGSSQFANEEKGDAELSMSTTSFNSVSEHQEETNSNGSDDEDTLDVSRNSKKPKREKKRSSMDSKSFEKMLQLIDLDPWDENVEFDEAKFLKLIDRHTKCCQRKYALEAFDSEIYPLSAVCAFGASLNCVKKCCKVAPSSVEHNDESLGTPLHYACSFKAPIDVVKYLARKYPKGLKETDEFKRTPLHAAALFQADIEVVTFLIKEYPSAASEADEENMTPLHLAIEAEDGVNIEIVKKLLKINPAACTSRSLTDGVTPLMLGVARKCPDSVLKEIIKVNNEALKIPDKEGRIPLHVAAALKAEASTISLLMKSFPAGVKVKDNAGETAWHLAKKVKLKPEILAMLKPLNI